MAAGRPTRRERERQRHRNEILRAAERVFVSEGYAGATVERVAQEADFAVGTLYNFFENKEKLFEEVIANIAREAFEVLQRKAFGEADPKRALRAVIDLQLRLPQKHRGFARAFFEATSSVASDQSIGLPKVVAPLFQEYIAAMTSIIRRGVEARVFRDIDPLHAAVCLEGAFRALAMFWMHDESREPVAARVRKATEILLGMICLPEGGKERRR